MTTIIKETLNARANDENNGKTLLKGSGCSRNGNKYELEIYKIVSNTLINERKFNTQSQNQLGGSSILTDIVCNYRNDKDVGIEIKKSNSPDWCQCSLKYDIENKRWFATKNGKNPKRTRSIFNKILKKYELFNGDIPPFMLRKVKHSEWLSIKKNTNKWNDIYIDIPNNTINKLYRSKNCHYIQISEYGLYHLGDDICDFGVPEFDIEQEMRIRTKIHQKTTNNGYCSLSVMASCKPIKIKNLIKSTYSLDDIKKLPLKLKYAPVE
jgi:hypothetical protein